MTEPNQEALAKHDLTGALARVPADVIEILGAEKVAEVERLSQLSSNLLGFSRLPNPYNVHKGTMEIGLPQETYDAVAEAIEEQKQVSRDEDSTNPEISRLARKQAPLLNKVGQSIREKLTENFNAHVDVYNELVDRFDVIDPKDPKQTAQQLALCYDTLETIARELITPETVAQLIRIQEGEYAAGEADARIVGFQKKPELLEQVYKLKAEGDTIARLSSNNPLVKQYIEKLASLRMAAEDRGRKSLSVRRAHRKPWLIHREIQNSESLAQKIKPFRDKGARLFGGEMVPMAKEAARATSLDMFNNALDLKKDFSKLLVDTGGLREYMADPEALAPFVAAEKYIADNAALAEAFMRQSGVKLDEEARKTIHDVKETRVGRVAKRLGEHAASTSLSPYQELEADADFRRACRAARDILAGGGRVNHPDAKRLAKELHGLRFGKDRDVFLEPEESGLVIGIAANQAQTLLAIVDRLAAAKAGEADAQVEKLRLELPEQHFALSTYNIGVSIEKLKVLLDDSKSRQTLLNVLRDPAAAMRVRTTIETLWHQRVLGETDYQEPEATYVPPQPMAVLPPKAEVIQPVAEPEPEPEPETEEPVELEPEVEPESEPEPEEEYEEPEPTEAELQIIDEAMTDIAEQLEWTVFPPGTTTHDIRASLEQNENLDLTRVNWERIDHLLWLSDNFQGKIYRSADVKLGTKLPYLVSEITVNGRRFAVAECPQIGNATYIVDDMAGGIVWEDLMRLHKNEARELGAKQVVHPTEDRHLKRIVRQVNSMLVVRTISGR